MLRRLLDKSIILGRVVALAQCIELTLPTKQRTRNKQFSGSSNYPKIVITTAVPYRPILMTLVKYDIVKVKSF